MLIHKREGTKGFTIVELLIVVVVIAILAAITLVTYSGVQQKAENTKTKQAVAQYAKALQAYKSINGAYPNVNGCVTGATTICGNVSDTTGACFSVGRVSGNSNVDAVISSILSAFPQPSTVASSCNGSQYNGIFYDTLSSGRLIWFLIGANETCTDIGGTYGGNTSVAGNTTRCYALLP